jgi:hypothetical protein
MPMVRASPEAVRSAARAAQAASSGWKLSGCSWNQAESCGMFAEKPSFLTERCSICPIGRTKVSSTKSSRGSTSRNARRRARRELRASARVSGRPSAVRRGPLGSGPAAPLRMAAWGSSTLDILILRQARASSETAARHGRAAAQHGCQLAASQALKRSAISASWSAHHSGSSSTAVFMCSALVGICGAISVLPS